MFKEELIIVRHARSQHNVRASDDLDCDLTEWGFKQAKTVAEFLGKHIDLTDFEYYTSPFLRCLMTSSFITHQTNRPFWVDQRLREYINHSGREVWIPNRGSKESPNLTEGCGHPYFLWGTYPAKGVTYRDEFNEQLMNRLASFYEDLESKTVVVTHGLPAMVLIRIATGTDWSIPIWDHSIDNASITYIVKGRIVWLGRNLYSELDYDPFDHQRPYDECDYIRRP